MKPENMLHRLDRAVHFVHEHEDAFTIGGVFVGVCLLVFGASWLLGY